VKTIPISGVIGYDVMPAEIRAALAAANGSEVRIEISSPGGFVTDGLEIFNLIKNHAGRKTVHLMGLAASMASYIALAGDRLTAEANAVYMIHEVRGGALGTSDDLRQAAAVFEGFNGLMAVAYAAKSGKSISDVRALMKDETFYFGSEAKDAGFIDEVVGFAPAGAKAAALASARSACAARAEAVKRAEGRDSLPRLAAMLGYRGATVSPPTVYKHLTAHDLALAKQFNMSDADLIELDAAAAKHAAAEAAIAPEVAAFCRKLGFKAGAQ
jgi:ATP-dependent protease ClpP protease subunit